MEPAIGDIVVLMVAVATLSLTLLRPFGANEGVWTAGAAVVLLGIGSLSLSDAARTLSGLLGVGVFLAGLFWLSLAAERSGLISYAGDRVMSLAGGDGRVLLAAIVIFGTATTAMLSNDGTVVLVTPVVIDLCRRLKIDPLPYAFAVTFVADSASSLVPVANPVNILFAERLGIGFGIHVAYLAIPTIVALIVTTFMLLVVFANRIPRAIPAAAADDPVCQPVGWPARLVGVVLVLTAVGYVLSAASGIPPYWITLAGGIIALLPVVMAGRLKTLDPLRVQPPGLYAFVAGLALIVAAVEERGLLARATTAVDALQQQPEIVGILGIGFGSAIGSNLINNWTMALILIPPLDSSTAPDSLILAGLFGTDIGPNLTIVGSLATLIWMTQVRRAGIEVSAWTYLRLGMLTTISALLAAMLALAAISWLA